MKSYSPTHRPAGRRILSAMARLVAVCALGTLAGAPALAADPTKLQAIDVQPLPGQQLQVTMRLSGPATEPLSFTIDNPARISFDLPNTSLALPSRRIDVKAAGLDTILAAEAKDRTRLVLNLDRLVPYETRLDGNNIVVTLGSPNALANAGAAVARPATAASASSAAVAAPRAIRNIDFRRGTDGAGRVIVKLTDPRTQINQRQVGNQIVVDFAGTELPKNLMRRFDATDFGTPVSSFDVVRANNDTRIVINANGDYEHLAYQSDDQYVIEISPARKPAQLADDKPVYTGERITLSFQDVEIRALLQILADTSGQNIVVTDSVQGSMTLRLQSVPWDQALDIVLRTKGLGKRQTDNVVIVAPADELAAREKAELAARKDLQELAPLRSEFVQVNYAKAQDMAELIKSQGGSLLSPRGAVSVDERTNTLLLQDTADRLADIRRLVATLDIPIRQVLIEARIVIVNDDFTRELGVRSGYTGIRSNGANGALITSGDANAVDVGLSSALANLQSTGNVAPVAVPTGAAATDRYNVNLPVTSPAGRIAFALLGSDYIVDLELSAAQAEGRGEVKSSPHIITANQKEASIEQGVEIPYQQAASSGATTVEFKKAVLSLKVTPQITPDNRIILDLTVKKDSVGSVLVSSGGVGVPSIDTREIATQVLVNDGQTVVLGGILETEERKTEQKVPYLGDVPVLGRLFKTTRRTNNKDELLIFVTPKILHEGVNVY
ncbi:MAG: type IV pilus secretin PilQ [Gammaproteobacteria bacterium]